MSVSKRVRDKKITISFYITKEAAQCAKKIDLVCEHNGWEAVAMKPQKNGTFRGSITVNKGVQNAYQYRFKLTFADGTTKFDNDWKADAYVPNSFGGENSVFYVNDPKEKA